MRRRRELRADETKCSFGIFPALVESDLCAFLTDLSRPRFFLEALALDVGGEVPRADEQEESS